MRPPAQPEWEAVSRDLYLSLFGGITKGPTTWLIELDGSLYNLPLSMLVADRVNGRPVFMIERHSAEILPGVWALRRHQEFPESSRFLGLGDGIYNIADARIATGSQKSVTLIVAASLRRNLGATPFLQLPRLVESRREIAQCARRFGSQSQLLMGADLTRANMKRLLHKGPI